MKLVLHHGTSQDTGHQSEPKKNKKPHHEDGYVGGKASQKRVGKRDPGPCFIPAHSLLGYLLAGQRAGVALQQQHVTVGNKELQPG